jgi:flavin reductase (DIM6/NTAB) family NADH-FMN oxidoreductase RutF
METILSEIPIRDLRMNVFDQWDRDWFLLTSGDYSSGKYNSMTVAWGSIGNMWNRPFVMVVVRPSRYTYEFINSYPDFSLCGFSEDNRKALNLLGVKSGRDGNKIKESGLTAIMASKVSAPVFKEAELSIECRKIYFQDFNPAHFNDLRIEKNYPDQDYHRMVFGEIIHVQGIKEKFACK